MITASGLDRAIACPSSEALPHVKSSGVWAEGGTARHTYLENVGRMGRDSALAQVPDVHREMCEAIDLEGMPTNLACEVAFAWDWETGEARELGRGLGRDYSTATATEICGTIDTLGVSEDSLFIGDYKGFEYVAAKNNPQLYFAAMCASKVHAKDSALLEIVNIRADSNTRNRWSIDAFDMADFENQLRDTITMAVAIKSGSYSPNYNQGTHCRYCPAFDACPAKTALMRTMSSGEPGAMITAENATHAYQNYLLMKAMMSKVTAAVHAYAAERPIELGDGRVFGSREKLGNEKLDGDCVYGVIRDQLGQEAADLAVKRSATNKGIADAVKHAKPDGTLKAATDRVLTAVRSLGGAKRETTTAIDEHKA